MSLPKDEFKSSYYDFEYFADEKGKEFKRGEKTEHWGYMNKEGEFLGAKDIAQAWKVILNPEKMLDVGCGRGVFLTYARDMGIESEGFDYSEYAINNPYPRCKKEWLKVHDATQLWPYDDQSFDLVTALDFYEHIYVDLPNLPCDVKNLIYLKCFNCVQERDGLCPLKLALSVNIGENISETEKKTQSIDRVNMRLQKLGEKDKNGLILNAGKKEPSSIPTVAMQSLKMIQIDGKNVETKIPNGCANGEKLIKNALDSKLENNIKNVWNTSASTQKNIKNFWKNTAQIVESITIKEKISSMNLREVNAKFVETQMSELLKSIILKEEEKRIMIGYLDKIGVNCNSCVPTVIRLCTNDLDFVISEMFRVAKKWIFLQIATVDGVKERGYILKKGEPIPWEDGRTWAGHCTVMSPDFWVEKFERDEWMPRRDMVNWFCSLVDKAVIRNWLLNTIIVLEKI